jgi:hypothetical protein
MPGAYLDLYIHYSDLVKLVCQLYVLHFVSYTGLRGLTRFFRRFLGI